MAKNSFLSILGFKLLAIVSLVGILKNEYLVWFLYNILFVVDFDNQNRFRYEKKER